MTQSYSTRAVLVIFVTLAITGCQTTKKGGLVALSAEPSVTDPVKPSEANDNKYIPSYLPTKDKSLSPNSSLKTEVSNTAVKQVSAPDIVEVPSISAVRSDESSVKAVSNASVSTVGSSEQKEKTSSLVVGNNTDTVKEIKEHAPSTLSPST